MDLETISSILQQRQESGTLSANLQRVPSLRGSVQAILTLSRGKLVTCSIYNIENRVLMEGEQALTALSRVGTVAWAWSEGVDQAQSSSGAILPQTSSPIPRRLVHIEPQVLNTWPRNYRRILVLIDGERSIEKIAEILALSSEGVQEMTVILRELRQKGVINF